MKLLVMVVVAGLSACAGGHRPEGGAPGGCPSGAPSAAMDQIDIHCSYEVLTGTTTIGWAHGTEIDDEFHEVWLFRQAAYKAPKELTINKLSKDDPCRDKYDEFKRRYEGQFGSFKVMKLVPRTCLP